jgi:predicted nuclease of predicted toxin-antitoxin system
MKILIDMNLSPAWVPALKDAGLEATHWSKVGEANASDERVCAYARTHGFILFTHDLDFGAILAATHTDAPSVLQIRTQNVDPEYLCETVVSVFRECREYLEKGALISFDKWTRRVRILPIGVA